MNEDYRQINSLSDTILEFYSTSNRERHAEIHSLLASLHESDEGIAAAFKLIEYSHPAIVRYFGSCLLYELISKRWEYCLSLPNLIEKLKTTLLDKLTHDACQQNLPTASKLVSSLALLVLYCLPDVWQDPFGDIVEFLSGRPELFLRVLAEVAAGFHRTGLPLEQRRVVKSVLINAVPDVIKMVTVVLSGDLTASVKSAASECIEHWLKLPESKLTDWGPHFDVIISNIMDDCVALERLFNAITNHQDLPSLNDLSFDLCGQLTKKVFPFILHQLSQRDLEKCCCLQFSAMICTLAQYSALVLSQILVKCNASRDFSIFNDCCAFLLTISNYSGRYPIEEVISDIPNEFWYSVKEAVLDSQDYFHESVRTEAVSLCNSYISHCLQASVNKIAYSSTQQYSSADEDLFSDYRTSKAEIVLFAYEIEGEKTLLYILSELSKAIGETNLTRVEALLFLLHRIVAYVANIEQRHLQAAIGLFRAIGTWFDTNKVGTCVLSKTLLETICGISPLILRSETESLLKECVVTITMLMKNRENVDDGLVALTKFLQIDVLNMDLSAIGVECYRIFVNPEWSARIRLNAVKCLCYCAQSEFSLALEESLEAAFAPQLQKIQTIVDEYSPCSSSSFQEIERECAFSISVLSTALSCCKRGRFRSALAKLIPPLSELIVKLSWSEKIVDEVCRALKSCIVVENGHSADIQNCYLRVIGALMLKHESIACDLAKAVCLAFPPASISCAASDWLQQLYTQPILMEEHIDFLYHFVRKNWPLFTDNEAFKAPKMIEIILLMTLRNLRCDPYPALRQKTALLLAVFIEKYCKKYPAVTDPYIRPIFVELIARLRSETSRETVDRLADALYALYCQYPQLIRLYVQEDSADATSQFVGSICMGVQHSKRQFRLICNIFNQTIRRKVRDNENEV